MMPDQTCLQSDIMEESMTRNYNILYTLENDKNMWEVFILGIFEGGNCHKFHESMAIHEILSLKSLQKNIHYH